MGEERRREGARETIGRGRVEALSDGIFAIVLTLLVLELQVPYVAHRDSPAALGRGIRIRIALAVLTFLLSPFPSHRPTGRRRVRRGRLVGAPAR